MKLLARSIFCGAWAKRHGQARSRASDRKRVLMGQVVEEGSMRARTSSRSCTWCLIAAPRAATITAAIV
jgi:hypothetical protein